MPLFKILGLLSVFSVSVILGYSKALLLKKRQDKLALGIKDFTLLCSTIRLMPTEKNTLIQKCISEDIIFIKNGKALVNPDFLTRADILLFEDFLSDFGKSDTVSETARCELLVKRLQENRQNAEENCNNLCRLYTSFGVLGGVAICIFLI